MAEDEQSAIGVNGERGQAVRAQVGAEGDGVHAQPIEDGVRVGAGRRADVAALGIQNDRDVRRNQAKRGLERRQAIVQRLVEGDVGLVRTHQVSRGFDDGLIPGQDRIGGLTKGRGHCLWRRVKANAEQRIVLARGSRQFGKKVNSHAE